MRKLSKSLAALAALSMTATPVLAEQANPAAKLSISPASARIGAAKGKQKLAGGFLIAAIAVVAVIAGVVIVATDDNDSN